MSKRKVSCTLCHGKTNCARCDGKGVLWKITCGGSLRIYREGAYSHADYKKCARCGKIYGDLWPITKSCNEITYEKV